MQKHPVVSREDWLIARQQLLQKEKDFTRQRDQLSQKRQALPWMRVEKNYVFDALKGKETLSSLFDERSQLLVYHFMFESDLEEGCPSCSFLADNFNGTDIHLKHWDVTLIAISKAPLKKLEAFKSRMGWNFKWVSSFSNDFNHDYHVSFTPEEKKKGEMFYNYRKGTYPAKKCLD